MKKVFFFIFITAVLASIARTLAAADPEPIVLWPHEAPVSPGVSETNQAFITVHLAAPQQANGAAVVICPGGGYGGLVMGPEGHGIAQWLNQHGIAGIVLQYRLPRGQARVPLLDAQRALRTVRSRAKEWSLNPNRIGIMGFSAGGHLASSAGTHFDAGDPAEPEPLDRVSCRPDFMILIYPVISLLVNPESSTKHNLLGDNPAPDLVRLFSNETQVSAKTPPTFLAHAQDDRVVLPAHSRMFYDALKARQIPAEYLELPQGGHGLNGYQGPAWVAWQNRSLSWLADQGFIPEGDAASPTDFSLAGDHPVEKLRSELLPQPDWKPFPKFPDRDAWAALPEAGRKHLVKLGEEALDRTVPALPATLYLEFARNGNRSRFEAVYFERREILQALTLAECVEAKGRFRDAIANALWAICEESTWCVPAHIGAQKSGVGLPDTAEPIVDLFAAETGVSIAWTLYLLGPELDRVSTRLRGRAERELANRILTPVFERDNFGWMALNVTRPDHRPNNWTPWIAASVLTTALTSEPDADRRTRITHKMLRSLDGFLKFYPADGGCDEGPGYWTRAGGSLLDCLDLLHSATGGKIDVFREPLIQEIGRFIYRVHIDGEYYIPVGDCPARLTPEHDLVFRYGKRIQDPNLLALAAGGASAAAVLGKGYSFGRRLYAVFDLAEILALPQHGEPLVRDVWLPSQDMQLMAARSRPGSSDGLYVAAWGSHNAQSHNHNDVGNFLVFANGRPVFVDVGAPAYTAQTFSSRRYEIWAFQSAFHNLPTINGAMQSAGRQYAARSVQCQTNDVFAELQMDIGAAYPPSAQVNRWVRTVRLTRGESVEITDTFQLKAATGETSQNLITPLEPNTDQPGKIRLRAAASTGKRAVNISLEFDSALLAPSVEPIDLSDNRLARSWGKRFYRIILRPKQPALHDTWKLRLAEEK